MKERHSTIRSDRKIHSESLPYIVFLLLAIFLLSPILRFPNRVCAGNETPDLFNNIYTFEWFYRSVTEEKRFPLRTDGLIFPDGASLFIIDPLNALVSLPFRMISNPFFTKNFIIFYLFLFNFFALYLLIKSLTENREVATLSSILGTCSTYVLLNI